MKISRKIKSLFIIDFKFIMKKNVMNILLDIFNIATWQYSRITIFKF